MNQSADRQGLLLVGHGTRDAAGTEEFFELASLLANQVAPIQVEGCLLEFQRPTIPEAWERLVERGVGHIRVAPLLLFAAGHARADIPEAVFASASLTPQIRYDQSGPLSRAPSIVRLLQQRITEVATKHSVVFDDSTALVVVGRGSYDPCATADMLVMGEVLAKRFGMPQHRVGFYAMAEPKLPGVLDEVASRPGVRRIIVQPHLLFKGRLYDAIVKQTAEAGERNPAVAFSVGDYLGPTAEVAEALAAAFPGQMRSLPPVA